MLAWLTKLLENTATPIGTVVHIGAGVGIELSVYQDLNCEHILAIEPDDALFKKLETKASRFDNVTAQQAWISDTTTDRNATIFANPRFNSLLPADKMLLEHFPNVKETETLQVKTQSFDDVMASQVKQTNHQLNVLVLEVQGFEMILFQNSQVGKLQLFNWIVVRASEHSLFKGGSSAKEVKKCLAEHGFELRLSDTSQLPFVEQYYELNTSKIKLKTVKDQLTKMNHEFAIQQQKLADKDKLVVHKEEINTQLKQKLLTVTGQNEEVQATLNELQTELKLNKENNSLLQQTSEKFQQELQDSEKQIESLKIKVDDLTTQLNSAKTEVTELQKSLKNESHSHHGSKKWTEALNKKIEALELALNIASEKQKSAFQTLSLNTKLMTKLQVDGDGLRRKLTAKTDEEKQLKELVCELHEKLKQAADFYHKVQQHYPDLINSES